MNTQTSLLVLLTVSFVANTLAQGPVGPPTCSGALAKSAVPKGFCPRVWANDLGRPRGIDIAPNGDVLTIERDYGEITALWDDNGDGKSDPSERANLAIQAGLNHAVMIGPDGYLYASSATSVYRWKYNTGDRKNLGASTLVVHSIPCCHHTTRTLEFDQDGLLYVQVGSGSNVDPNTSHARINRFNVTDIPSGGLDWNTGFVYANGLRNEVGMRFDSTQRLWGVENGVDNLRRADLGGDIHTDNPVEELNLFATPGQFYGYPYCWSVGNLTGYAPLTQMAQPEFMRTYNDSWCQNTTNVKPPIWGFQAHSAPLDIIFWNPSTWGDDFTGDAFVSFHGSWNRVPAVGYRVDRVQFKNGMPVAQSAFLKLDSDNAYQFGWLRPVAMGQRKCGSADCLLVSSDETNNIVVITQEN